MFINSYFHLFFVDPNLTKNSSLSTMPGRSKFFFRGGPSIMHTQTNASLNKKEPTTQVSISNKDMGLVLNNSILSFDNENDGQLTFLSSANVSLSRNSKSQIIATEETIRLLECRNQRPKQVLVCQYNRPFSVGKLKIELLPSGCMLGSASLFIQSDFGKVLYAPALQPSRIPTIRQMQLKKADTLVLGCQNSEPSASAPSRKKEKERFVFTLTEYIKNGMYPLIVCNPLSIAPELTKLLSDCSIPVAVHNSIYRINKIYESYGSPLGKYSLFQRHKKPTRPIIFPEFDSEINRLRKPLPDGPVFLIKNEPGQGGQNGSGSHTGEALRFIDKEFFLPSLGDGYDLKEVIHTIKPKKIYLHGPYLNRYLKILQNIHKNIVPLFPNNQPLLF